MYNLKDNNNELALFGKFIDRLYRNNSYYIGKHLEKFNINKSEYKYMIRVYNIEGLCQDDLVNMLQVDKYEVAKGVKSLIEKGYIHKEKDKVDKRKHRLYLTEKAKEIEPEFRKVLIQSSDILTKDFDDKEKEIAMKLLIKMTENITNEVDKLKPNR